MPDFPSEGFRTAPNDSAAFGTIPQNAESFRTLQNASERTSDHTLRVREVARMFEAAGVARTERSITNWCQPNKTGIARLDAFFDPNERRYFITPKSVELAIQEEQSKENATSARNEADSGHVPNASAGNGKPDRNEVGDLRREMMDLQITNRAKDMFIEQLQKERASFDDERKGYVETLMKFNRRVGQLETRLGIEPPTQRLETLNQNDESDTAVAA